MRLVGVKIVLENPHDERVGAMEVEALADSGALHLCIPEHVAIQLQLREIYRREVTTADGHRHDVPYVGPVHVRFGNRGCFTGALVLGDQVLLGAVPMEDMDLIIHPALRKVVPNPESPNIPMSVAKRLTGIRGTKRTTCETVGLRSRRGTTPRAIQKPPAAALAAAPRRRALPRHTSASRWQTSATVSGAA
jgi:clan AA aspartic protease